MYTDKQIKQIQALPKHKNRSIVKRANGTLSVSQKTPEETKAQQQYAETTKISYIMKQYNLTGMLNQNKNQEPMFDDFTNIPDYQTAQKSIAQAYQDFEKMPAQIKKEFNNNPAEMLDWLQDSKNKDKAIEYGLITQQKAVEPTLAEKTLLDIADSLKQPKTTPTPAQ